MESEKKLLHIIFFILIICGTIYSFIGNRIQKNLINDPTGYNMSFIGSIFSIIGLFFILPIIISKKFNHAIPSDFTFSQINFPTILTMIVISFNLSINSIYKNQLNNSNVVEEYYKYSHLYSFTILLQLIILCVYVYNILGDLDNSSIYDYSIYLFSTINIVLISIMRIILKYYTTDG